MKARALGLTETRIDAACFAYEDDSKGCSDAEKCALRYADLMFLDANQVNKAFYDEMKAQSQPSEELLHRYNCPRKSD